MDEFLSNCLIECLERDQIPPILSCSRLIPFNKTPGKIPTKSEIRNIATQPILIQLFESLAIQKTKQVCNYDINTVDNTIQKGFLSRSSTQQNLKKLTRKMKEILNLQKPKDKNTSKPNYYIFFIDFKQAFDRVILSKLKIICHEVFTRRGDNFTAKIVDFILENYHTSLDGKEIVDIHQGCPQGSRLSPLFFIMYINELIQEIKTNLTDPHENIYAFADDIAIICKEMRQVNKIIDCLKKAEK